MQRYFALSKHDDIFTLTATDYYHIYTVMRMKVGDKIEVVYENTLYIAILEENRQVRLVNEVKTEDIGNRVTLCIPLLSDQKMSFVLQKATELGVYRIIPIVTSRSVVKIDAQKEEKKIERWLKICKEASEQSKRCSIPIITPITKMEDLVLDGLKMVCSTVEKENTIKKRIHQASLENVAFAIGPEGGFTSLEEQRLQTLGFLPTSLGKHIMRVETVPIYVMSVLNYEMME